MDPLNPISPPGGAPSDPKHDETPVEPISPQTRKVGEVASRSLKDAKPPLPERTLPGQVPSSLDPTTTSGIRLTFSHPPGSRKNFDQVYAQLKNTAPLSVENKSILKNEFRAFWASPLLGISKKTALEMKEVAKKLGEHEIASKIDTHLKDFEEEFKAARDEIDGYDS